MAFDISRLLGKKGDPGAHLLALEKQFGSTALLQAKVDVCIGLLVAAGVVKSSQVVDLFEEQLKMWDLQKQREAGVL